MVIYKEIVLVHQKGKYLWYVNIYTNPDSSLFYWLAYLHYITATLLFTLAWIMLIKTHGKFMFYSVVFYSEGHYISNDRTSLLIFMYSKISESMLKRVFHITKF